MSLEVRKFKRYRYFKITPENLLEIKELLKKGVKQKKIAEIFNISTTTVQYYINPHANKYRKEYARKYRKEYARKYRKEHSKKYYKYLKEYLKERYNNDSEFRERFIGHVKKSQKKIRAKNKRKGLCPECGNKRDSKFLMCGICRKKKRDNYHKNEK